MLITKALLLQTDASENGVGAVLYQVQDDGTSRVIAYPSRTLSKSAKNYDAYKLEFLALNWVITFHEYLYGGDFEVFTDNNPFTYLLTRAKLDATGPRWVVSLANYNFKCHYRSGKLNVEADALLRIPWEWEETLHTLDAVLVKAIISRGYNRDSSIPEIPQHAISIVDKKSCG